VIPWWAGMLLVLAALGVMMLALRWYQRRYSPPPEIPRKMLHVGMGLIVLTFPWLFQDSLPVIALGVIALGAMLSVRYVAVLRRGVGGVVHGVERESSGEIYFPVAVAMVFWLAGGRAVMFAIPVLMLALADAVAALIGLRYGTMEYTTGEAPKTIEGSVAFFTVAFLSVLVPLLLWTAVGRVEVLLIAVIMGLLVMLLEAVSWHGLDNLFIPLGGYAFLKANIGLPATQLLVLLGVLLLLVGFAFWWRKRTTLTDSAALAAALAGYVFWALGGWVWLMAPLVLFLTYAVIPPMDASERERAHDTRAVAAYATPPLVWIFLATAVVAPAYLFGFTASLAALSCMTIVVRLGRRLPDMPGVAVGVIAVAVSGALMFLPWLLVSGVDPHGLTGVALGIAATVAATGLLGLVRTRRADHAHDPGRWAIEGFIAMAVSMAAMAVYLPR
jgi:phytol kinase